MAKDGSASSKSQRASSSTSPRKTKNPSSSQSTLNSFFAKPKASGPSTNGKGSKLTTSKHEAKDVIDLVSDDDDIVEHIGQDTVKRETETDEQMAHRLAREDENELEEMDDRRATKRRKVELNFDTNGPSAAPPAHIDQPATSAAKTIQNGTAGPPSPQKAVKTFPMFDAKPSVQAASSSSASHPATSADGPSTPTKPKAPFATAAATSSSSKLPAPVFPDLDVDPLLFDPESVDVRSWPGGRVTYEFLVEAGFVKISATKKRLIIGRILTNLLRTVIFHDPTSLISTIYLFSNHIAPSYTPASDLGIGSQILTAALKSVTGLSQSALRKLWNQSGDSGDVAFDAKVSVRTLFPPPPLIAHKVYGELVKLSNLKGTGVQKHKGEIVQKLLVSAKGEEVRFLVRTLVQHLRIGAVRLTITTALARAITLTRPPQHLPEGTDDYPADPYYLPKADRAGLNAIETSGKGKGKVSDKDVRVRERWKTMCEDAEKMMRRVYVRHPNYDHISRALISPPTSPTSPSHLSQLATLVPLTLGIPLSPMLGSITRSLADVFTRLEGLAFTSEAKLDGQRVQIHVRVVEAEEEKSVRELVGKGGWWGVWPAKEEGAEEGGKGKGRRLFVRLFSRHLEEMTEKYPDIITLIQHLLARKPAPPSPSTSSQTHDLFPHLTELTSFVLDAEIVAIDISTGAFKTFQELSNRAKKDVKVEEVKVQVGVFAFDLMGLEGVPLLDHPLRLRRHLLRTYLPSLHPILTPSSPLIARFDHVESIDSTDPTDVGAFFEEMVRKKAEGLMVKLLDGVGEAGDGFEEDEAMGKDGLGAKGKAKAKAEDGEEEEGAAGSEGEDEGSGGESEGEEEMEVVSSTMGSPSKAKGRSKRKALPATYQPDVRSLGWLKVKKDYLSGGIGDSLDLVPIGAWHGSGRKAGWWSPILLACYNPDSGMLEAVCKCISGFTDAFYKDLKLRYPEDGEPDVCWRGTKANGGNVDSGGLIPDFWFAPREVWEIKGADITLSPVYPAASTLLGGDRGLSLRFPRFLQIREDKGWEDATSSEQFAGMYRAQSGEDGAGGGGEMEE